MAGGRSSASKTERRGNDFYPTPPTVTRALLAVEQHSLRAAVGLGSVWEPCGRGGAIIRELTAAGYDTLGTDIVADPDNLVEQQDLLTSRRALGLAVVTNPPFALAEPMISHLLGDCANGGLAVEWCALLLKATFWHASSRSPLFRRYRPQRIRALNWRPDFLDQGAPTMEVMWCVWDRRSAQLGTQYSVLAPPSAPGLLDVIESPG
jgi:hypothetical protein